MLTCHYCKTEFENEDVTCGAEDLPICLVCNAAGKAGDFPASDAATVYMRHVVEVNKAARIAPGRCHLINTENTDYNLDLIKDLANNLNVGKKSIIVIKWPSVIEIQRLPDGTCVKTYYRYNKPNKNKVAECSNDGTEEVLRILKAFLDSTWKDANGYDKKITRDMKEEKVISYAYIQRRLTSCAAFRKSIEGAKNKLKRSIEEVIENGSLEEVPEMHASGIFGTNGKLYRIIS